MTTKLSPEEALLHPRRAAIMDAVRSRPGIHLKGLARLIGCGTSPILHHARKLQRAGLLLEGKRGHFKVYYIREGA